MINQGALQYLLQECLSSCKPERDNRSDPSYFRAFCKLESPEEQIYFLIRHLLDYFSRGSLEQKHHTLVALGKIITHAKSLNDDSVNERIALFKRCLTQGHDTNWKDRLIHQDIIVQRPLALRANGVTYRADKRADHAVQCPSTRFQSKQTTSSYAVIGSTFVTTREQLAINESFQEGNVTAPLRINHNVDACFSQPILDQSGLLVSLLFGVADGCGHPDPDDECQLNDIVRTAYFSLKYFLRLSATFRDPDEYKVQLHQLLKLTESAVAAKTSSVSGETTTLSAGCAFRLASGDYRVIGLNIGDSAIYVMMPTGEVQVLGESCQVYNGFVGGPPAFPNRFSDDEVIIFDQVIPAASLILGMTDGVIDALPNEQSKKTIHVKGESRQVLNTTLKLNFFSSKEKISPKNIVDTLTTEAVDHVNTMREVALQNRPEKVNLLQQLDKALRSEDADLQERAYGALPKDITEKVQNELTLKKKLIASIGILQHDTEFSVGDDYTLLAVELPAEPSRLQP